MRRLPAAWCGLAEFGPARHDREVHLRVTLRQEPRQSARDLGLGPADEGDLAGEKCRTATRSAAAPAARRAAISRSSSRRARRRRRPDPRQQPGRRRGGAPAGRGAGPPRPGPRRRPGRRRPTSSAVIATASPLSRYGHRREETPINTAKNSADTASSVARSSRHRWARARSCAAGSVARPVADTVVNLLSSIHVDRRRPVRVSFNYPAVAPPQRAGRGGCMSTPAEPQALTIGQAAVRLGCPSRDVAGSHRTRRDPGSSPRASVARSGGGSGPIARITRRDEARQGSVVTTRNAPGPKPWGACSTSPKIVAYASIAPRRPSGGHRAIPTHVGTLHPSSAGKPPDHRSPGVN